MKRKQMILVVGLGRFGTALCEQLSALSQNIVAVDADKERVASVSDYVDIAAQADATDEDALVKVGAKEADVFEIVDLKNKEGLAEMAARHRDAGGQGAP